MGRDKARRLSGSRHFRQRLVLAMLTSTPVTIVDIRADGTPGLRDHEVSLLRLLDKISDHSDVEINETGTFCNLTPSLPFLPKGKASILFADLSRVCSQGRS
jgi:RNA 3'-terminal phosphate cyclase-like protein